MPRVHLSVRARVLVLTLVCAAVGALGACDGGGTAEGAAGAEGVEAAAGGHGLVIVPDDPALAGLAPEEIEARGARPYFHDFGEVAVGEVVQHVFRLKNTNAEPLSVTRMQASCGCTQPTLVGPDGAPAKVVARGGPILTLAPGAEADLIFKIDTAHSEKTSHNQDKLYTVQMATDAPGRGAYLRFEAHVFVVRAFQATPQPLELGRVPQRGGARATIDVVPVGTVGARVVGVGELPPGVRAEVIAEPLGGSEIWKVEVALEPPLAPGAQIHRFDLLTEDKDGFPYHPFPIEVRAFAVGDLDWNPQRFVLRNAAVADGPLETSVDLYPLLAGERIEVTAARLAGEGTERLELALSPLGRDAEGRSERWTLTLRTKPPFGDTIVRAKAVVSIEGKDDVEIDVLVHPR